MTDKYKRGDWDSLSFPPAAAWRYGGAWYREYPHIRDVPTNQQHLLRPYTTQMLRRRLADGGAMPAWFSDKEQS